MTVDLGAGTATGGNAQGDLLTGIETIGGTAYADPLTGDVGANTFWGRAGDDRLMGGAGNDVLYGEAWEDTLRGGDGNDILVGGAGIDTANYAESSTNVSVNLASGSGGGGDASGGSYVGIENVFGSGFSDSIWADDGVAGSGLFSGRLHTARRRPGRPPSTADERGQSSIACNGISKFYYILFNIIASIASFR